MVEPVFLAILAITFLVILVIILKGGNNPQPTKEKTQKKQQPAKEKKPKAPKKTALKKDKRPSEVKEWSGVDTAAKDAHEMLEFLKGRDPAEIAKQHVVQAKQQSNKKKGNNNKKIKEVEVEDSPVFEVGSNEGFSVIQKAKKGKNAEVKDKTKNPEVKEKKERNKSKAFFKEEEDPRKKENKKGERRPRKEKPQTSEEGTTEEEGEKKKKPQGEREFQPRPPRENKDRPPREEKDPNKPRERRERKEKSEDEEQSKPKRAYPTSPPNVAYVEADLNDILNAITQDYNTKPKPQTHRIGSVFSKIPRSIVSLILSQLEAPDLVALSEVNYYFSALARKDVFWKDLLLRDFGVRDSGNYRSFKAAYKVRYKKKNQQHQQQSQQKKKQEKDNVEPQDELKDINKQTGKKDNKKKKEETEKATVEPVATSTEEVESKEDKE